MHKSRKMIAAILALAMVFACAGSAFAATDTEGHWAQAALDAFEKAGYIAANEAGEVQPGAKISAAELSAMIAKIAGTEAKAAGSDPITREDAFVAVADQLGLKAGSEDALKDFSDASQISEAAKGVAAAMVEAGYVNGVGGGKLSPKAEMTKAEAVTLLSRAEKAIKRSVKPEGSVIYGTTTLSYADFYSGDVSSTASYDAVSSATNGKSGTFPNALTDFVDKETNAKGYKLLGVKNVNVAVSADDYEAYLAIDPEFVPSAKAADQYKTVSISGGKAGYSATKFNVARTVTNARAELKTGSTWGDYEIDVYDNEGDDAANLLRRDRQNNWTINSAIMGIILETSDGFKVGMEHLQSIWVQPWEVSFNVTQESMANAHIAGGGRWDNIPELSKFVGKNITKIHYIMPNETYVYEFDGIYIKPAFSGESPSASFSEGSSELSVSGIPAELENAKVSVIKGTGRGRTTIADAAEVKDGKVTMTEAYDPTQTYTVRVSSDNYADIIAKLPMSASQKAQFEELMARAEEVLKTHDDKGVKAHL